MMPTNPEILKELEEISPAVANLDLSLPYRVPDGYFEGLADQILSLIRVSEALTPAEELNLISPTLKDISRSMPNFVPAGYFDGIAEHFFSNLKETGQESVDEEIHAISPLLGELRKKQVFEVPEGYFNQVQDAINLSKEEDSRPKIVPIINRKSWMRYAAAAVVIAFVAGATWLLVKQNSQTQPGTDIAKTSVENKANDSAIRSALPMVSDDAIAAYLDNEEEAMGPIVSDDDYNNSMAILNADESDFKFLLHDIPDDEIQQYLKENPGSKDDLSTN